MGGRHRAGAFSQNIASGAAGAAFIVFGKITNFSFQEREIQRQVQTTRGAVMQAAYQQDAAVRVDFRVVSTSSGVAVVTESGDATVSVVSAAAEMARYRRFVQTGVFNAEAQDSLFGRTTIEAIRNAVRKLSDLSAEMFKQIGTNETDPYEILRLERELRLDTGGLGINETIGELSRKFQKLGSGT